MNTELISKIREYLDKRTRNLLQLLSNLDLTPEAWQNAQGALEEIDKLKRVVLTFES